MDNATIAAISTPAGSGGIGIIRISGPDALAIAKTLFLHGRGCDPEHDGSDRPLAAPAEFRSHRLYYGHILDPSDRKILDEVLLAVMKGPRSYTREDVVEIQAHSGYVVLNRILGLVLAQGARLAEPGEFTRRAYLGGRIDLTQAEAVIDIVNARAERSLSIAATQIRGELRSRIESLRETLFSLLAEIEAGIDFPDDVGDGVSPDQIRDRLEGEVAPPVRRLLRYYREGHLLRDGVRMGVVGRPNVGKSSLMNRLIRKDRVIVAEFPGTTRDSIEETLSIRGLPIIVIDTAGLHDTEDPVEAIGIRKTREVIDGSDLILFVVDAGAGITAEDRRIFEQNKDRAMILVVNKVDLIGEETEVEMPAGWEKIPRVRLSALYNFGIDALRERIVSHCVSEDTMDVQTGVIPNLRHKVALEAGLAAVEAAVGALKDATPLELVAIHVGEALDALGRIVGTTGREELLGEIFDRFCIGK